MYNFVQSCLNGDAFLDEIDDFIDQWHDSDSEEPLHEYLGLTEREYLLWVEKPEILPFLVTAHKEDKPVGEILSRTFMSMAARSGSIDKALELQEWLKQKHLMD